MDFEPKRAARAAGLLTTQTLNVLSRLRGYSILKPEPFRNPKPEPTSPLTLNSIPGFEPLFRKLKQRLLNPTHQKHTRKRLHTP